MAAEAGKVVPSSMLGVPVQQLLDDLVQQRSILPDKDPELSRLDNAIIPLMALVRKMLTGGPYDIVHDRSPPSSPGSGSGCLLQDLKEVNLYQDASDLLGVKYLSPAASPMDGKAWPVHGALYGLARRSLVSLPTQLRPGMPCVNVFFLVDTGAPITEISPSAFTALGSDAVPPLATCGFVNGVPCQLQLCAQGGNHPDIPLLGADYLARIGAVLTVNYKIDTVTINLA